jgi:SAM-dependent methyltransferase
MARENHEDKVNTPRRRRHVTMLTPEHDRLEPSAWIVRFAPLVPAGAVLDVAAGTGRHARLFAGRGHAVVAVDRDIARLEPGPSIEVMAADLEAGPWPFPGRRFAGVVVANYLHRPLFPHLVGAVAPGGALIYETFAKGNERFGKPSNPDFLLGPGELLDMVRGRLRVVAYEDVTVTEPRPACVQRIAAVNEG